MGKIDPTKERERLAKLYAEMSDLELAKVGRDPEALTEWARDALLSEISRRGLEWKPEPRKTTPVSEEDILMLLRKYDDRHAAAVDRDFLERSGIAAYFFEKEPEGLGDADAERSSAGTQLIVRAKDLALARQKLTERDEWENALSQPSLEEGEATKPVVVRRYRDMPQAFVGRSMLENAGIKCFLQDDNVIRMDWLWSNALGGIKLIVGEKDLDEAERVLAEASPVTDQMGDASSEKT